MGTASSTMLKFEKAVVNTVVMRIAESSRWPRHAPITSRYIMLSPAPVPSSKTKPMRHLALPARPRGSRPPPCRPARSGARGLHMNMAYRDQSA